MVEYTIPEAGYYLTLSLPLFNNSQPVGIQLISTLGGNTIAGVEDNIDYNRIKIMNYCMFGTGEKIIVKSKFATSSETSKSTVHFIIVKLS